MLSRDSNEIARKWKPSRRYLYLLDTNGDQILSLVASHRRCTLNRWTWTNLKANDRFSSNNRVTPSTVGDYWLNNSDIVYEPVVDNLSWLWRIIIFVPPISSLSIASLKRKPSNNAISCLRGRAREIVGLSSRKDLFDSGGISFPLLRLVSSRPRVYRR